MTLLLGHTASTHVSPRAPSSAYAQPSPTWHLAFAAPGGLDLFAHTRGELREMIGKNHPTAYWARREGVVVRNPAVWDALWGPEPPES